MVGKTFNLSGKLLIFQIWWNTTDEIEDKYQQLIDKNTTILEGYPHYIFTKKDIELFLKQNTELKEIFNEFSKNVNSFYFQSDLLRFMILYKYGGIYLDLDVELYNNFYEFYNELNTKYKNFELIPDDKHIFFLKFNKSSKILERLIKKYLLLKKGLMDSQLISFKWMFEYPNFMFLPTNKIYKYMKHYSFKGIFK